MIGCAFKERGTTGTENCIEVHWRPWVPLGSGVPTLMLHAGNLHPTVSERQTRACPSRLSGSVFKCNLEGLAKQAFAFHMGKKDVKSTALFGAQSRS